MNYFSFVSKAHQPFFVAHEFGQFICDTIDKGIRQKDFRLIISMPPRHGKSMLVTETLPAYFLLNNPDKKVILSSYNQQLATRFGHRNKEKFITFAPSYQLSISNETKAKHFWEIEDRQGALLSSGIFGGLTGMGADLLIIDDPIKNERESTSYHHREQIFSEYQHTLRPRLHAGGSIILIMTRWHEDDLAGRLLKTQKWQELILPAFALPNDLLHRKIGHPLWKERYGKKELALIKKEIGSRSFESLYQQNPTKEEGEIFNTAWWQKYKAPIELSFFDTVLHSWDCSFTGKETSDYVVGQVWGKKGANSYLLFQVRKKMDFVQTVKAIESMYEAYPTSTILVEAKANGEAIISTLRQKIPGIIPVYPTASKISRALAITPFIEAGNVYLPINTSYIEDYLLECQTFPYGKHDDMVDATTQALQRLYQGDRFSF